MNEVSRNAARVQHWLDAINLARKGPGIQTLSEEYHKLFRSDAVMYIPGDTALSGQHVGFDGWFTTASRGFEIASDNVSMELEDVVANESVCAAILNYSFERPGVRAVTRAVELRWFGEDDLVWRGEFIAADWPAFAAFYS